MLKKNIITIILVFTALFSALTLQTTYAALPTKKPAQPPKPPQIQLTPGERYKLHCANQQLQQSMNNLARAGYNIGATMATLSKK